MTWKRRWGIVTALALSQAAIIICYQGFFAGNSAPAHAQAPTGEKQVVTPKKDAAAKAPAVIPVQAGEPPLTVSAKTASDGLPDFSSPPQAAKTTPAPDGSTGEPPMLTKELGNVASVPVPPTAPVAALPPEGQAKPREVPALEGNLVPVKGVETMGTPPSAAPATKGGLPEIKPVDTTPPPLLDMNAPTSGRTEFTRTYAQAPAPTPTPAPLTPPSPNPPAVVPPNPSAPAPAPAPSPAPQNLLPPPAVLGGGSPPMPGVGAVPMPKDPEKPAPTQAAEPVAVEGPCPWTLRVEIIKGRTLLTAQTGQEVQFRVTCDKLDLQAPRGNIKASGNVKVESEGLKGACEQLSIAWQQDQVVLEGNAELKSQRDGQDMDLKAAKLSLRLSVPLTAGQPKVTSRTGEVRGATFLSRSKSARGEVKTSRPRPNSAATGALQPVPADGGYDRYIGSEPPRRGSKIDE